MHTVIRTALEKYLNDNGAAAVCKTHLDRLTDSIVESLSAFTVLAKVTSTADGNMQVINIDQSNGGLLELNFNAFAFPTRTYFVAGRPVTVTVIPEDPRPQSVQSKTAN